jgi:hypothetical protein
MKCLTELFQIEMLHHFDVLYFFLTFILFYFFHI